MLRNALFRFGFAVLTATTLGLAGTANAQDASDMSADQLKSLFATQKTRGLVLAPTTAPSSDATDSAGASAEPASAPSATYVELPKDEQVNIQIRFDFDSAALRNDQKPKLATLCEAMKSVDVKLFRIVGHTDASGSAKYNAKLSLLRAKEVKRYLVNDCGIESTRLEAVGVGEDYLLDAKDPNSEVNRRVEFQAVS